MVVSEVRRLFGAEPGVAQSQRRKWGARGDGINMIACFRFLFGANLE